MNSAQHARLMELFDLACELPKAEVAGFLAALRGDDSPLANPLQRMLNVDRKTQIFFDQTQGGAAVLARDLLESALLGSPMVAKNEGQAALSQVGEYEILERLGAGGMGSVYRARQRSPERIVALKMLHPWLVSPASLERFRFEAQALASLKHPSIPPVFAVGQHEGAVYFAMELVNGPNLTAWVAARASTVRERVQLLVKICDAVHHAHLRGFVHRDLKPDNIRVLDDGTPQVLDFGISAGLGERAEVAGTPAYMSPEQLEPGAVVDVRSDVFSLGVIAFELLAEQLPAVPLKSGLATLQALKNEPSPRLQSVVPKLGSELDSIVAKALRVRPDERYASVAELGDDLTRHLCHQPVSAHAGGVTYRITRFVQRNRLAVSAVSGIMLVLASGAIVSLAQYLKAERARAVAATQAERAKASLDFLNTVLQGADTGHEGRVAEAPSGRGATIGEALDRAALKLANAHLDPHVELAVRTSLANTYVGVGEWKNATEQARLAQAVVQANHLEPDEDLAELYRIITQVHEEMGETAEAVVAAKQALAVEQGFHGDAAVHTHLSNSEHVAAIALRDAGALSEAVKHHLQALKLERALGDVTGDRGDLSDMLDQYGMTLVTIGKYDEALVAHQEALNFKLAKYGPAHQNVATSYHHLGSLEYERGNYDAAAALFDRCVALRLATLGKDHVRLGLAKSLMARIELARGHVDLAAEDVTEAIRVAERSYGAQFGRYVRLASPQVLVWLAQGKRDQALELSQQLLDVATARFGAGHYVTAEARSNHALALLAVGHREQAIAELTDALAVLTQVLGEAPRVTRDARARLAQATAAQP